MNPRRSWLRNWSAVALAAIGCGAFGGAAIAQTASGSTLRIVVPYPAGGTSDRAARLLADALQPRLGMTVLVENVVGAGGRLAMRQLAGGPADANVLVLANPALMVVAPVVYKNNGYDAERDFQAVAQVTSYEFAAAVAGAVPVREFSHLLAWAKANPEKANFGVPATGSLPHFFALMVGQAAAARIEVIGYKGSAPMSTDLLGGHLPVAIDSLDALLPLHEGGKLRILATSGRTRAIAAVPTFEEAGLKLSAIGWNVLYARPGMPAPMVERLAREVAAAMKQDDVRKQFLAAKAEPVSASREQTVRMLAEFKAQWVPVIQKSGLQFE